MKNEQKKLSDYNNLILGQMDELILVRKNTWDWVGTPHTIKDTQVRIDQFRALSDTTSKIARNLTNYKSTAPSEEAKVDTMLRKITLLQGYERDIQECLNRDYDAQKKASSDSKVDYVKNVAFVLSVPGLFVTGVKNGVGNGHIDVNEALVLGFAVSVPTVFHKTIGSLFSKAAKAICLVPKALRSVPAAIGRDIRVYYVKEMIKEKTNSAHICFSIAAKAINDNVQIVRAQTKVRVVRLLGWKDLTP